MTRTGWERGTPRRRMAIKKAGVRGAPGGVCLSRRLTLRRTSRTNAGLPLVSSSVRWNVLSGCVPRQQQWAKPPSPPWNVPDYIGGSGERKQNFPVAVFRCGVVEVDTRQH